MIFHQFASTVPLLWEHRCDTSCVSIGLGIKESNVFANLSYNHMITEDYYQAFTLDGANVEGAHNSINNASLSLGLGVKF